MLVQHLLETGASRWPHRIALVSGGKNITYGQLDAEANRAAHAFLDSGVKRGDRVAILLENGIEVAIAIFGALKAGAIFMVLPPGMKHTRMARILA